ncbi:MAG: helix-turn-helix domain-containing protein [Desulfarculaceae bacterium]|jgi:sugar-specific transcriptional regulator TrmB
MRYVVVKIATMKIMEIPQNLLNLGFTKYEAQVYLALIAKNPQNGSQLSRASGVPRANIYNTLDGLRAREIVMEVDKGLYAAIPVQELIRRLRLEHNRDLSALKSVAEQARTKNTPEYVWTMTGYEQVMAKARDMIAKASRELFIRLFPEEGEQLKWELKEAEGRGVVVKYVSLGPPPMDFEYQIIHPELELLAKKINGRSLEMVADHMEVITGCLTGAPNEESRIAWATNKWLAFSIRDAILHDFYHAILHKIHELGEELTEREKELYQMVKMDFWDIKKNY